MAAEHRGFFHVLEGLKGTDVKCNVLLKNNSRIENIYIVGCQEVSGSRPNPASGNLFGGPSATMVVYRRENSKMQGTFALTEIMTLEWDQEAYEKTKTARAS